MCGLYFKGPKDFVIEEFCDWLSMTPLSVAFQSATWFVPLVQTVHIIAIAILLMSIYLIGFRLLGLSRQSPSLAATVLKLQPWIWSALCVLLLTGILLTITEPARELLNWVFRTKMVLVLILASTVAIVQSPLRRDPEYWSTRWLLARCVGALVLIIGAGIITAGRWIAYV
jgi:magnesium-transporting ATPase (P-type)